MIPTINSDAPEIWNVPGWFSDEVVAISYDWSARLAEGEALATADVGIKVSGGLEIIRHNVEGAVSIIEVGGGNGACNIDLLAAKGGRKMGTRLKVYVMAR